MSAIATIAGNAGLNMQKWGFMLEAQKVCSARLWPLSAQFRKLTDSVFRFQVPFAHQCNLCSAQCDPVAVFILASATRMVRNIAGGCSLWLH